MFTDSQCKESSSARKTSPANPVPTVAPPVDPLFDDLPPETSGSSIVTGEKRKHNVEVETVTSETPTKKIALDKKAGKHGNVHDITDMIVLFVQHWMLNFELFM